MEQFYAHVSTFVAKQRCQQRIAEAAIVLVLDIHDAVFPIEKLRQRNVTAGGERRMLGDVQVGADNRAQYESRAELDSINMTFA